MGFFSGLANTNPFTAAIEGEYNFNKKMAKRAEQDSIYMADQRKKEGRLLLREQVAAYSMSGVELQGTPMELMKRDQINAELEAMNIIYSGKVKAAEMKYRAKAQKNSAYLGLAMQAGSMALGAYGGGGGAVTGAQGMSAASTGTKGYSMAGGGGNMAPGEMLA